MYYESQFSEVFKGEKLKIEGLLVSWIEKDPNNHYVIRMNTPLYQGIENIWSIIGDSVRTQNKKNELWEFLKTDFETHLICNILIDLCGKGWQI